MKKNLNQKLIDLIEYYNLINSNLLLSEIPLKRNINNMPTSSNGTKLQKLENLKKNIKLIKNCEHNIPIEASSAALNYIKKNFNI